MCTFFLYFAYSERVDRKKKKKLWWLDIVFWFFENCILLKFKITRRPADIGVFCAFLFWLRFLYKRCKSSYRKYLFLHHIFYFSQLWKIYDFQPKNLTNKVERRFSKISLFQTHTINILPHLAILKIHSQKNLSMFPKNRNFWTFWKILLFELHWTAKLQQISEQKNSRSETWTNIFFIVNAIGRHRVKKTHPFKWIILLPYYTNMEQNINLLF